MYRVTGLDVAREVAEKENLAFGFSIVSGDYFVGTQEELENLPVIIVYG